MEDLFLTGLLYGTLVHVTKRSAMGTYLIIRFCGNQNAFFCFVLDLLEFLLGCALP